MGSGSEWNTHLLHLWEKIGAKLKKTSCSVAFVDSCIDNMDILSDICDTEDDEPLICFHVYLAGCKS